MLKQGLKAVELKDKAGIWGQNPQPLRYFHKLVYDNIFDTLKTFNKRD